MLKHNLRGFTRLSAIMVRPMTCPICGKPVSPSADPAASLAPFCSERCKQIDFFRWNDGRYAIVEPLDPARLVDAIPEDIDPELLPDE
jgi:uncharacterized protein